MVSHRLSGKCALAVTHKNGSRSEAEARVLLRDLKKFFEVQDSKIIWELGEQNVRHLCPKWRALSCLVPRKVRRSRKQSCPFCARLSSLDGTPKDKRFGFTVSFILGINLCFRIISDIRKSEIKLVSGLRKNSAISGAKSASAGLASAIHRWSDFLQDLKSPVN